MKKLFSSIIMVMMIALAFTLIASAENYTPDTDGLYNIEYAVTAEDGTQFGMVVIEATGDESKIEAILKSLQPFGIQEIVKTGISAMVRSPKDK